MASVKQAWIKKYGYDKGLQMWESRKKQSASSLESFIKKYGDFEGPIKYQKWKINLTKSKTLDGYIEKYGEILGTEKYKEKNKKLSVSTYALKLSGRSDDEIKNIKQKHANNSLITLETLILKYGHDIGTKKWNARIFNAKISSKRSLEYWIRYYNGDENLAKIKLADYQRRDKNFYIKKYGEIVGIEKFENAKKQRFLGGFKEPCSHFQKEVEEYIRSIYEFEIRGHENCFCFFDTHQLNQSVIIPDILLEKYKIIIECFGDYWHCSSKKYDENFFHEVIKKTAKEIRAADDKRIDFYKNHGYHVVIVWENEWINDKIKQKELLKYEIDKKRNK
jgi:hypothetical protein